MFHDFQNLFFINVLIFVFSDEVKPKEKIATMEQNKEKNI